MMSVPEFLCCCHHCREILLFIDPNGKPRYCDLFSFRFGASLASLYFHLAGRGAYFGIVDVAFYFV